MGGETGGVTEGDSCIVGSFPCTCDSRKTVTISVPFTCTFGVLVIWSEVRLLPSLGVDRSVTLSPLNPVKTLNLLNKEKRPKTNEKRVYPPYHISTVDSRGSRNFM